MKKTLKDYFIVLFGSGMGRAIALVNSIVIARCLGVESFGRFSIFYVLMIIIWQFPQSFDVTYVRYAKTVNSKEEKNDFLKSAVFLKLLYSGVMLCISIPLASFLARYCFNKPDIQALLVYSIISGVFLSFLFTVASIFQEKEKFIEYSILNAIYTISIFLACLLVPCFRIELTLNIVVVIYLVTTVLLGIVSILLLFKKTGWIFPLNINVFKRSFSLGKWIFGVTVASFIFQRLDVFFLARYVDFRTIGLYSAAVQMIMAISLMTGSLNGISLPKASEAIRSKKTLRKYIKESIVTTILINCAIVVLIIISPSCLKLLYGRAYLAVAPALRILLIGWMFAVLYVPFSSLFYAIEDSRTRFFVEASKIMLGALLLNYLIPRYGVMGAAFAMSFTLFLNTCISLMILKYRFSKLVISN